MAINSSVSFTAFIVVVLVLWLPFPSGAVPSEELERAISVLRVRGRALFANSITTSDILFDIFSAESLTLLVPTDAMLFNLDMTYSLPFYISTLRLHVLPLRLPISDLRSLPNASSIPTFLPSHRLLLTKPPYSTDSVYLDGVQILLPGLFYDEHIAVHGLAGILQLRSSGTDVENFTVALPPMVDSPAESPSPWSSCSFSPSSEAYFNFFGRTPAETPMIGEVSVSPSLEEALTVGDGDSWTTEF
ncbi:fasciclin-like arabinogalactan protein 19 [Eutrema salsugineum]|uniref:fasciclin-like arabinogalactan protein 19 n=1 Tax=Eutrema salsugineum TaxID=72664 RepID=UPI000CED50FB|nr:fasciclin-like arabinogalactan protein 19 [Eutrema salsugineum]